MFHRSANAVDLKLAEASVEPTTLEVANRLFPNDGFSPLPEFLHTAATQYGAGVEPIDADNGAAAADTVNRWVSQRAHGLIPTIVTEDVVQDQKLTLVNTVHLNADWAQPFLPEWSSDGQFSTDDTRSVTVPFMSDRVPVHRRFVKLEGADAVEFRYQGGELAMWLVVPHDPAGLAAVEESLDAAALTALHSAAQEGLVDLTMPKWEQTLPPTDLFAWLCPLGFCAGARFDGIADGIFITAALHGAKVIVDEKGTEAAAATAVAFRRSAPPPADLTIVADRPFSFGPSSTNTPAPWCSWAAPSTPPRRTTPRSRSPARLEGFPHAGPPVALFASGGVREFMVNWRPSSEALASRCVLLRMEYWLSGEVATRAS